MALTIESLPIELLAQILSGLDGIGTLKCAVTSVPTLLAAYHEYTSQILTSVLAAEIGSDLLQDALMIELLDRQVKWTRYGPPMATWEVRNLLENWNTFSDVKWDSSLALAASKRHRYIHKLTCRLGNSSLERMSTISERPMGPPSPAEELRLHRALYRFEMYWILLLSDDAQKRHVGSDLEAWAPVFFQRFAPWENEELGCVLDFLYQILLPGMLLCFAVLTGSTTDYRIAFNDLAFHDILWGAYGVEYAENMNNTYVRRLITRGLEGILAITEAEDYESRLRELGSVPPDGNFFVLKDAWENYGRSRTLLDEYAIIFHDDPDNERQETWDHCLINWLGLVDDVAVRPLRAFCYISWDYSRLEVLGLFDPWIDTLNDWRAHPEKWNDYLLAHKRPMRDLVWSSNQRARLYRQGVRGYWASPEVRA